MIVALRYCLTIVVFLSVQSQLKAGAANVADHGQTSTADLEKLLFEIVQSRMAIKTGVFEVSSKIFKEKDSLGTFITKRTVYLSDDSYRCDSVLPMMNSHDGLRQVERTISCHNCEGGFHVAYDSRLLGDGIPISLYMRERSMVAPHSYPEFDPGMIGLFPADIINLHHFTLSEFKKIFAPPSSSLQVKDDTVTVISLGDVSRQITVSLAEGFTIRRAVAEYDYKDRHFVETVELDWRYAEKAEVWLPTRSVYTQTIDDKIYSSEDAVIVASKVNEPLDQSLFSLAGMDLPAGLSVMKIEGPKSPAVALEWDGSSLIDIGPSIQEGKEAFGEVTRHSNRHLLLAVNFFAVVAVFLLTIYRKRRSA
jgi:hypothetical protein